MANVLLKVKDLQVGYGGIQAKALGIWSNKAWPWCRKAVVCSPA